MFGTGDGTGWQLDRLRVLATQATPAEAAPGETVAFESLVYQPDGESLEGVVWFGCLNESATSFGCTIDPEVSMDCLNHQRTPVNKSHGSLDYRKPVYLV